jgi:hypothetical protein
MSTTHSARWMGFGLADAIGRTVSLAALSFIVFFAAIAGAKTEELKDGDLAALQTRVDSFTAVIGSGDFAGVFDYMPPKVLSSIATQYGASVEQIKDVTKKQIEETAKTVKFDSFQIDTAKIRPGKLSDGMVYALIPTETVMTIENAGRMRARSETLALKDEKIWYLVRIDDKTQIDILRRAYPGFSEVEFASGSMEEIQ